MGLGWVLGGSWDVLVWVGMYHSYIVWLAWKLKLVFLGPDVMDKIGLWCLFWGKSWENKGGKMYIW